MNEDGFRFLLNSAPLWEQEDAGHRLPVHVKTIYTVLGRRNKLWETVLASTDDIYVARRTMDAANASGQYNRIVITQGNTVNKATASSWVTVECALPASNQLSRPLYRALVREMQGKAANNNPRPGIIKKRRHDEKQSLNLLLGMACMLAALVQSPAALMFIAFIALIDCLFLFDKKPLSVEQSARYNQLRARTYAVMNGGLILVLLIKHIPLQP